MKSFYTHHRLFWILLFFLPACANPVAHIPEFNTDQISQFRASGQSRGLYKMIPGDTVSVRYPYDAEHDTKAPLVIQPDGNVIIEGIGVLQASGKTPEELAKIVAEKSRARMRDPEVVVNIVQFAPRRIFVGGEVKNPGIVQFQDGLTPIQAIFDRGGFTDTAQKDSVILIRDAASKEPKIGRLNALKTIEGGNSLEFALSADDVIYVPMSGIGRADLWVKQHLRDIIPSELIRPPNYSSFMR